MKWTPELGVQWQKFYNNASRLLYYGRAQHFEPEIMPNLPQYEDLKSVECTTKQRGNTVTNPIIQYNLAIHQRTCILFTLIPIVMRATFAI
jgi:hypothetical protein